MVATVETKPAVRERPILFSGSMVRAILDNRKTQTRRVVKGIPSDAEEVFWWAPEGGIARPGWADPGVYYRNPRGLHTICPPWRVGDKLWAREAVWCYDKLCRGRNGQMLWPRVGDADTGRRWFDGACAYVDDLGSHEPVDGGRLNKMFMPRWASRITLEVTSVWAQRVQDISEADAKAEGVEMGYAPLSWTRPAGGYVPQPVGHKPMFRRLWDSINAARGYGWDANPWVWVVTFKKITEAE